MGKQRRTDQEKITLIRQFEESALTAKQWCKENHISVATLSAWRKKFDDSEKNISTASFVEVAVPDLSVQDYDRTLKISCGQFHISVQEGISLSLLTDVLKAVKCADV